MNRITSQLPGRGAVTITLHPQHASVGRDTMSSVDIVTESVGDEGIYYPAQHVNLYGKAARALYDALKQHYEPNQP